MGPTKRAIQRELPKRKSSSTYTDPLKKNQKDMLIYHSRRHGPPAGMMTRLPTLILRSIVTCLALRNRSRIEHNLVRNNSPESGRLQSFSDIVWRSRALMDIGRTLGNSLLSPSWVQPWSLERTNPQASLSITHHSTRIKFHGL